MRNKYQKDIIEVLMQSSGGGMTPRNLARHIYNRHCGLFENDVVYERICRQVRLYLWRNTKQKNSFFQRRSWGKYDLKPGFAIQTDFIKQIKPFPEEKEENAPRNEEDPRQLVLF